MADDNEYDEDFEDEKPQLSPKKLINPEEFILIILLIELKFL